MYREFPTIVILKQTELALEFQHGREVTLGERDFLRFRNTLEPEIGTPWREATTLRMPDPMTFTNERTAQVLDPRIVVRLPDR